jgi:hypothetical protein
MSKTQGKSPVPQSPSSLPRDNAAAIMESMMANSALQIDGTTDGASDERRDQAASRTREEGEYVDVRL